ncbi:sodium nucleoside protein [Favolaschia claudopus]|uniref:Sodium nucleoside protein n=1 Tax=Favolaschia claudopus TaxID=2862362 RepID=A0AAW0DV21_9AGAR
MPTTPTTAATISFRDSIRWLPDEASEPTQTIVLTSLKSGAFLDVRFNKHDGSLDWAFAGFRTFSLDEDNKSITKFTHHLDSRTLHPLTVPDIGVNTPLPDGRTLEAGEMGHPATGVVTRYEEVWRDEEYRDSDSKDADAVFVRTLNSESDAEDCWRARVGSWQLALGRTGREFWAWQASANPTSNSNPNPNSNSTLPSHPSLAWTRIYSTPLPDTDSSTTKFLPDESITSRWESGSTVEWEGREWLVL